MNLCKIIIFFHVIVVSWYFFRANNLEQLQLIIQSFLNDFQYDFAQHKMYIFKLIFYISPLLAFQFIQYHADDALVIFRMPVALRAVIYLLLFYLIVIFGVTSAQEFIYFQF